MLLGMVIMDYDFPNIKQLEIDHCSHNIHIHYKNGDKKTLKRPADQVLFMRLWKIFIQQKEREKETNNE